MNQYIVIFENKCFKVIRIANENDFSKIIGKGCSTKFSWPDNDQGYTARVYGDGHFNHKPLNEVATDVFKEIGLPPTYFLGKIDPFNVKFHPPMRVTVRGTAIVMGAKCTSLTTDQVNHVRTLCEKYGGREMDIRAKGPRRCLFDYT